MRARSAIVSHRSPASIVAAAFTLGALAACADPATSPSARQAPTAPSRDVAAAATGSYLVLDRGNGFNSDFAARVAALGGTLDRVHAGVGLAVVSGLSSAAATQLAGGSDVSDVQADAEFTLDAPLAAAEADASAVATDVVASQANPTTASRYSWQWNMRAIGANKAWAAGKLGDPGVKVAILDTGIDYDAPDLNGLVDLTHSASFIPTDDALTSTYFPTRNPITDYHGHGTNVATQVASKAVALAGVTSKTTLFGVKVLGRTGSGALSAVLSGVLYAADQGADVANMSLGSGFEKAANGRFVSLINRVFNYANRKGTLIVVSAGNETEDLDHNGNELKTYCNQQHVVCVSAVGPTSWDHTGTAPGPFTFAVTPSAPDEPAFFTNFGRSAISVAGPGGNAKRNAAGALVAQPWPWGNDVASWVWSYCSKTRLAGLTAAGVPVLTACAAGNRITGYIGTSQASPHVAGLAALLVVEQGHGRPAQLKNAIQQSADDLGQTGTDPFYGRGRANVARALGLP